MFLRQRKTSYLFAVGILALPALAAAQSPQPIGELFASETTPQGPVLLAGTGMSVVSGSELAAGKSVATLRLNRGGEMRICPNGSITVSAPQNNVSLNNQELMIAMNSGSVEMDYPLNDLADTLITPDFKIMLAGPGVFHFALGVNNQGDTCIKPMRGNSASIIVSEMMGNGVYQVKPDEAIFFAGGKLTGRAPLAGGCGCPRPAPVMQAEQKTELPVTAPADVTAPLPPSRPDAPPVQVETPFVFHGDQPAQTVYTFYTVAKINFSGLPNMFLAQENSKPVVLKPGKGEVSQKNKEKKGFFGRIKGFFASLFHR